MMIDTHLHQIDRTALSYPWLANVPALNRDHSYAEYAREARRAGITATLHMEVDVDPAEIDAETDFVKAIAQQPDSLVVGATASCRPEEPGFPAYLERVAADPFVKGLRRLLQGAPEITENALFRENIRRLAGTGLTFDFCVYAHQIPKAIALADQAPDVPFVLDHCGNPPIAAGTDHPWREHITAIAERPNVTAKISGLVNNADPDTWTAKTLEPYVEHVIGAFGWDRVIWGSDWPVCKLGGTLSNWVAATHAMLAGTSLEEREQLLWRNAARLWTLDVAA